MKSGKEHRLYRAQCSYRLSTDPKWLQKDLRWQQQITCYGETELSKRCTFVTKRVLSDLHSPSTTLWCGLNYAMNAWSRRNI